MKLYPLNRVSASVIIVLWEQSVNNKKMGVVYMSKILEKVKVYEDYMINFRRELHMYPELSGQEFETQKRIIRELEAIGLSYKKVGNTSIVATLNEGKGKVIALRADIDALPILEQTEVDYRSKNSGVMHACGHDAHSAMMLGAAKVLNDMKDEVPGEVRFIFQEAEELFAGSKAVIASGALDGVDAFFGMHNMPTFPSGQVEVHPGFKMAGCDTIYVKFEGVSGHGSTPHKAKDTVHPACLFVTDLQGIITKNIDAQHPVVVHAGRISGGTKANIVSKYAEVDISMRYFHTEARKTVHEAIKRHAKAIADMYEITAEVNIEESALSLYNDEKIGTIAEAAAEKIFGEGNNIKGPLAMSSEDMPYYFQKAPGAYAFLGSYNEAADSIFYPHHEKYNIDEGVFKLGAAMHVQMALEFLSE